MLDKPSKTKASSGATNTPKTKPLTEMIGEVAVVASIHVSVLGLTRQDKQASADSDANHGAAQGVANVNVKRLPGSAEQAIDKIKQLNTKARKLCVAKTMKWGEDRRLLPNVNIPGFLGEFEDIRLEHGAEVNAFVNNAHAYLQEAYTKIGSYNVAPPTLTEMQNAFSLRCDLSPVPTVANFGDGLESAVRQRFEDDIRAAVNAAQTDALTRLAGPLEKLAERMKAYDERLYLQEKEVDVGQEGTFKASVVSNITEIGKVFRSFNILRDPMLDRVADELEAFEGIGHADLVKSPDLRKEMAAKAKDIRAMLSDWLD